MFSKVILWLFVLAGLATPIWIACLSYWSASMTWDDPYSAPRVNLSPFARSDSESELLHDRHITTRLGPLTVTLTPGRLASAVIFLGASLVIIGTGMLFHVR